MNIIMLPPWSLALLSVIYVALDAVNFKVLAPNLYKSFYKEGIVDNRAAAAIYILYPLSIVFLTRAPTAMEAVHRGLVLGLTGYGLYHATNMATLKDWAKMPTQVMAWDTVWGGIVTSLIAYVAFRLGNSVVPKTRMG